jgi:uncharacterized protein YwgA
VESEKQIGIIAKIVSENPGKGKTALMKYVYLLQKVYKVPMGYDYSIYTYGPYSSEVMADIDFLSNTDILDIKREKYDNGTSGYNITLTGKGRQNVAANEELIQEYKSPIKDMLSLFGNRNAKDLELLTTIIYVYSSYIANHWNTEEVPGNVHDIKSHFNIEKILFEYKNLDNLGILQKAVA